MDSQRNIIRSFKDLEVFQKSYKLSVEMLTQVVPLLPKEEKYDLGDQLSRSSKAIPRLIAEGYGKRHQKRGFQKYLDDAISESNETQVGMMHVKDLYYKYVDPKLSERLISKYDILSRQIYMLRKSWRGFDKSSKSISKPNPASKPFDKLL